MCCGFSEICPGCVLSRESKVAATVKPRGKHAGVRGVLAVIVALSHAD